MIIKSDFFLRFGKYFLKFRTLILKSNLFKFILELIFIFFTLNFLSILNENLLSELKFKLSIFL